MLKGPFILQPAPHPARSNALQAVAAAQDGMIVTISKPTRTLAQNAIQHPIIRAIAAQVKIPVNGVETYLDEEDMRHFLAACFRKEQARMALGIEGGLIMLGVKTSKFTKAEWSDWIEYLYWVAAQKNVELPLPIEHEGAA